MYFSRRLFLAVPPAFAAFPVFAEEVGYLTVTDAHQKAKTGEIVLIDIRRPDEWQKTGIAEGAVPIDMRVSDLGARIDAALKGNRDAPVALICHTGIRSSKLAEAMAKAGFSRVYDVGEGMGGSSDGPGWVKRGLPVERPQ